MRDTRIRRTAAAFAVLLMLAGCGKAAGEQAQGTAQRQAKEQGRTVSAEFEGFGASGLSAEQLKESGAVFEDGPVEFQDSVTEEMLRNMLGKKEGEVLRSELQKIHGIYWRYDKYWSDLQMLDGTIPKESEDGERRYWQTKQPSSIEDLALCDNLQWVEFGKIELPSLAPLKSLTQLEMIGVHGASATKERMDELAALPALKGFVIGGGGYTDWSEITDGSFLLPAAERLVYLEAGGEISWNTEVLAQMKELELLLMWEPGDLSFLPELPKLRKLYLSVGDEIDGSPIGEVGQLDFLSIVTSRGNITGVTLDDLRPLKHLRYLGLSCTELTEEYSREEIIEALPSLKTLNTM